jgi:hypothetical protein
MKNCIQQQKSHFFALKFFFDEKMKKKSQNHFESFLLFLNPIM